MGGILTGLLGAGQQVTWRARHFFVWQELTSTITGYERPRWFRDEQLRGIFSRLQHDHFFEEAAGGGTLMRDVFVYRAPLGPLGWLAERLVLDRYLRRFLIARNAEIKAVAESGECERYLPSS